MIEINNLTTNQIDEAFLKKVCQKVLREEKLTDKTGLSIALIGQGKMRKLNKIYRGKNRITDVLAFPNSKVFLENFKVSIKPRSLTPCLEDLEELGEVVICLREVKKNAKKFNSSFEKELSKCLIHGILHLLKYNHEKNEKKAKIMREKEEYYLKKIQIPSVK